VYKEGTMIDLAPPFLEGAAATPPTGLGEAPVVVGVEAVGETPAAESRSQTPQKTSAQFPAVNYDSTSFSF
jgi:hypothetical protein